MSPPPTVGMHKGIQSRARIKPQLRLTMHKENENPISESFRDPWHLYTFAVTVTTRKHKDIQSRACIKPQVRLTMTSFSNRREISIILNDLDFFLCSPYHEVPLEYFTHQSSACANHELVCYVICESNSDGPNKSY